jgi:hypothetical protein
MKKFGIYNRYYARVCFLFFILIVQPSIAQEIQTYTEYSGNVTDSASRQPLEAASVVIKGTNISTVCNSEGDFLLKVIDDHKNGSIVISHLGYTSKEIKISGLSEANNKILLSEKVTNLNEVNLLAFTDAEALVRAIFEEKVKNNPTEPTLMTAFYRETIKRRNRNVSLTEAVVNLYKQPYNSEKPDVVVLEKARKSTDYRRLDTVTLKLQGGPFSTLYLDIMKYPEYIFTNESISDYVYQFEPPTAIQGKPAYVVSFNQKETILEPLYKGTLIIDAESLALTNAYYSLNIENAKAASELFVKKKPRDVNAYPTQVSYQVDYREKNGKWHYAYGNVELTFKVTKKGKLFNSVYTLAAEMAVTDWKRNTSGFTGEHRRRLKPTVVMIDAVSGFSDPDFWGPYNVIEPEKSIESAIQKIQRKIEKGGSS